MFHFQSWNKHMKKARLSTSTSFILVVKTLFTHCRKKKCFHFTEAANNIFNQFVFIYFFYIFVCVCMWGGLSCTTGVLWVMTTHLTCDRVHCFSVTGSITWTLWGGRWKSTCGAASKVHICASCSGSTQSSPRVEHPTYVSNTAGLIVNKSQLRKTKCSHVTHNKSVFFSPRFKWYVHSSRETQEGY